MATATDVLNVARRELGNHESPPQSNLQKYGAWYGFNGQPWCAMFVSWALHQCGITSYRFAAVAASVASAKKSGRLTSTPQPGFVACKLYTATKGHTGIVEAVHGDGTVTTIEGNTSAGDDRNGGVVMRRRRSLAYWNKGFIRVDYSGPQQDDGGGACGPGAHPLLQPGIQPCAAVGHYKQLANKWLRAHGKADQVLDEANLNYGPKCAAVTRTIQQAQGLGVDGECGPKTWGALHA